LAASAPDPGSCAKLSNMITVMAFGYVSTPLV